MKHRNRLRVKLIDSRCFRLSEELGVWFGFRGPVDRPGLRPRDEEREAMIDAGRNRVKKFCRLGLTDRVLDEIESQ